MKRYVLIIAGLILLLGLPASVLGQSDSANAGTEKEIRDALEKYRTALMQRDAATLKQIWADEYTFVNGAGEILTKEQRLANLSSGATSLGNITVGEDFKLHVLGDTAVSISRVTIKGQYSGRASSGDYQSMLVWIKRPAGWQLLANQLTPISAKH